MTQHKVGYFVGSLSSQSINRTLAKSLVRLAPHSMQLTEIPIGDLPLYNRDLDDSYPAPALALKDAIARVDAVLFVTPEYNRSIPGGAEERDRLGQPAVGPELLRAQAHRHHRGLPRGDRHRRGPAAPASILAFCNSPLMNAIEAYIQFKPGLFTDDGEVTDPSTEQFLREYLEEFNQFIARVLQVLPPDED